MRLKLGVLLLICVISSFAVVKADTTVTEQVFRFQDIDSWNIQDLYHNNTFINFTVTSGILNATCTVNYNNTNGTLALTPDSDCLLQVSANSTSFAGFFKGLNFTNETLALPANQLSTITWQWTQETIDEENIAYVVIGALVIGVVVALIIFLLYRKRDE